MSEHPPSGIECVFCTGDATDTFELGIREVPVCEAHHQSLTTGVVE